LGGIFNAETGKNKPVIYIFERY